VFDAEVQGIRMVQFEEVCTVLVLREISDRIAARAQRQADEQALRDAALHTQTILDNMVDGVISINAQGLVESFNYAASHMFGHAVHEVLGRRRIRVPTT
jgi:PAS domain-containing protein